VNRASPLVREATLSAAGAGALAALLIWLGPPGSDLAAHAYQRTLFLDHGFTLWNNFWYAGRYSFVTYSVLYYPLAALFGIRMLAVATVSTASLAFAVLLWREWGPTTRWSSRTFAVVWAGIVFSAAFPFALGAALALLALWSLQARRHGRFAILAALTLAASPLAFLLLTLLLAGFGISRWSDRRALLAPALTVIGFGAVEVLLSRAFPDPGRFPFSWQELTTVLTFCVLGAALTWQVERARSLRWIFVVYFVACLACFFIPSAIGENVARLRYAALPLAVLMLSLRRWRPLPVCLAALLLAISWNLTPIAGSILKGRSDPASRADYWAPAVAYLHAHLDPSYRVEAVDTAGHWPAVYLAEAEIPLARGDYRQSDFPQNALLYDELAPSAYLAWLRDLGIRYVVLTNAPPDYSSRDEAKLLRSGHSGLRPVLRTKNLTVLAVPQPRRILTGSAQARVVRLTGTRIVVDLPRAGDYRLAVRFSPYWNAKGACLIRRADGMTTIAAREPGRLELAFKVHPASALAAAVVGERSRVCDLD
jgi:hypothetical protein